MGAGMGARISRVRFLATAMAVLVMVWLTISGLTGAGTERSYTVADMAHSVTTDPATGTAFQADPVLNLVRVMRPDGTGGMTQVQTVPVGRNPVSLVFDPHSGRVLTADEGSGTITAIAADAAGRWSTVARTVLGFAPKIVAVEPG